MRREQYRLSLEELAMTMSLLGQPEIGRSLLQSSLGDMDEAEARARLSAAGHSLVARNWLLVDMEQGHSRLAQTIGDAVSFLAHADLTIRYARTETSGEKILAFHFRGDTIVSHEVQEGVVHVLTLIPHRQDVVEEGIQFLDLEQISSLSGPEMEVTSQAVEQAKVYAQTQPSVLRPFLQSLGIPDPFDQWLAEDLQGATCWGSVLRVEYAADGRLGSDKGFLTVKGTGRLWLFRTFVQDTLIKVKILPGSQAAFRQEVERLL